MADHGSVAGSRLKTIVQRIERLKVDLKAVQTDIGEVFAEAKGEGFDVKILRKVIKLRETDKAKRAEEDALVDLYMTALEGGGWDEPEAPRERPLEAPRAPDDSPGVAVAKGRQAARDGQPVTANPYPPGSANRAAWDTAWCAETGSDGMDAPAEWRPEHEGEDA